MLHFVPMRCVFLTTLLRDHFEALDRFQDLPPSGVRSPTFKAVFALVTSAVLLTLMNFLVLSGDLQSRFARLLLHAASALPESPLRDHLLNLAPLYRHIVWSCGCVAFYFVIPGLFVRAVFREPLTAYGLSPRGFVHHLPKYVVLFVPVAVAVVIVSDTPAFQATYPFYHNPSGLWDLFVWEFFYCLQFFALEFFFRGYLVHAMKERLGSLAVFAMVVPYCMIHFQKPMAEALAAILAGTVLGVLSLRTNTIWGGVAIHSAVAVLMDVASLIQRGWEPRL